MKAWNITQAACQAVRRRLCNLEATCKFAEHASADVIVHVFQKISSMQKTCDHIFDDKLK